MAHHSRDFGLGANPIDGAYEKRVVHLREGSSKKTSESADSANHTIVIGALQSSCDRPQGPLGFVDIHPCFTVCEGVVGHGLIIADPILLLGCQVAGLPVRISRKK